MRKMEAIMKSHHLRCPITPDPKAHRYLVRKSQPNPVGRALRKWMSYLALGVGASQVTGCFPIIRMVPHERVNDTQYKVPAKKDTNHFSKLNIRGYQVMQRDHLNAMVNVYPVLN